MPGAVQLVIDSDLDTVAMVARAVRAICDDGLGAADLDAVELALVEAMTNVIKHGYAGRKDGRLEVGIALYSDRVVIEIKDNAPPIPPSHVQRAPEAVFAFDPADIENLPEGGMGLALIRMNMDEVQYIPHGDRNLLRMTKRLDKRPSLSRPGAS
ncbi:ATP-binding protein [Aurantimonas sp. HBX-1]|uniref:ATP-binding protein n=1 Tax=Aurantimonas sp. HBX-1 TaxID=2906072 RepID=UPI001F315973|nr:ATP-binding protein [Aurantimonas sp. HBX-1]UIJ70431.1 ATP-binding protein [Aurantimonas sp. HBX-1]